MYEFKLPDIGEGVSEGEIVKWDVKENDEVSRDQDLVEIMTDKVTVKIPSPVKGKVMKLLHREGEVVQVGSALIDIDDGSAAPVEHEEEKQEAKPVANEPVPGTPQVEVPAARALASPAVRRIAREKGVDIQSMHGSGENGRVTVDDLNSYENKATAGGQVPVKLEVKAVEASTGDEIIEMHGLRRIIFDKMTKAKQIMPHFTVIEEVDVTNMLQFLSVSKDKGIKITVTGYMARILPVVLKKYPYLNAVYDETNRRYRLKKYYNIGIAVDTPEGLNVFVVKSVDSKSMAGISSEIGEKAERARKGNLALEEVQDSTFTITNIGGIGGVMSTPIINYPEVAILGVHRPLDAAGRKMMYLSLSCDHRLIDGAMATRFIMDLKKIIEDPDALMSEI